LQQVVQLSVSPGFVGAGYDEEVSIRVSLIKQECNMAKRVNGRMLVVVAATVTVVSICLQAADVYAQTDKATQLYLVGAGPGDPDLITLRAIRVLEEANLVFCSGRTKENYACYLEGKDVVDSYWRLFPYYGKDPTDLKGEELRAYESITGKRNAFIAEVRRAIAEGKTIAVLDYGDPLVYGPWAWCLEEFEDLDPVVVPGLSSFNAANAALKRGITTSDLTKSVILTASDWPGKTDTIEKLSVHNSTMVIFTMRTGFKEFIDKLSINYPPDTPIAVVKHAGYAEEEEVIEATLATIADRIGDERLPFEYLIYVGRFLTHRYNEAGTTQK